MSFTLYTTKVYFEKRGKCSLHHKNEYQCYDFWKRIFLTTPIPDHWMANSCFFTCAQIKEDVPFEKIWLLSSVLGRDVSQVILKKISDLYLFAVKSRGIRFRKRVRANREYNQACKKFRLT